VKTINNFFAVANAVLGAVNISLAFLWLSLIKQDAEMPPSERGYTVEALALNVTFLEIVLAAVGIGLAIVGVFGFAELRNSAQARAESVAREVATATASEQMARFLRQREREVTARHFPTQPSVTPRATEPGTIEPESDEPGV
jgi:hypothetical protein